MNVAMGLFDCRSKANNTRILDWLLMLLVQGHGDARTHHRDFRGNSIATWYMFLIKQHAAFQ